MICYLYCKDCTYKLSYGVLVSNMYMVHVQGGQKQ